MFGNLSISQRIGIGFMLMLVLLCLVVVIASVGIDYIVDSAGQLQEGNKLRAELMQHEINHLEWEDKLYTFLTDRRINRLDIQLDYRKCDFGRWLYGPKRRRLEVIVPELVPLFKAMEMPHLLLHKSAQEIQATFHRADRDLAKFLVEQAVGNIHLQWVIALGAVITGQSAASRVDDFDLNHCSLERWLQSEHIRLAQANWSPDLKRLFANMRQAHLRLHADAIRILGQTVHHQHTAVPLAYAQTPEQSFLTTVLPDLRDMTTNLAAIKSIALQHVQAENQSDDILRTESLPNHALLQQKLHEIRAIVDKKMVTDEKMLLLAQRTRNLITGISILALLLAAVLAVRTGRDIVAPLNHLTNQLIVDCAGMPTHTNPIAQNLRSNIRSSLFKNQLLKTSLVDSLYKLLRLHMFSHRPNINNGTVSNTKAFDNTPVTKRMGILQMLTASYVPLEVELLTQALSHYTESQTNMVAEQQKFIANVAHQLKNPLAGIYIQMDMILEDIAEQPVEQKARMIKLSNAIHRVGRLTHQLLALARCCPEAIDKQAMQYVNLHEIIEDNASAWFDAALPKHIDLGFEIEPARIYGVAWLVSEMLNNLVDNAIKHSPIQGKITVRCGHRNDATPDYMDKRPFLEVEDNGSGIPTSEREKVFERFYSAGTSGDIGDDSAGLGLAIVKEVTKYHRATIKINTPSNATTGTLFAIEFPYPEGFNHV